MEHKPDLQPTFERLNAILNPIMQRERLEELRMASRVYGDPPAVLRVL